MDGGCLVQGFVVAGLYPTVYCAIESMCSAVMLWACDEVVTFFMHSWGRQCVLASCVTRSSGGGACPAWGAPRNVFPRHPKRDGVYDAVVRMTLCGRP